MKNVHDQLAKAILKAVLRGMTALETSMEIRGHVLQADVWVAPTPGQESDVEKLGVLGRMIALGPCLVEPFSGVPDEQDVRSCILKQDSLHHAQRRDARAREQPAPEFPPLWVISTGRPERIIAAMQLQPMPDWPAGCFAGAPFGRFHLIIVRQLPRTPETLLVRLLSSGKTFSAAMHDLARVPETAPRMAGIANQVMHVIVEFRKELHHDQLEEDDMEALRDIDTAFDEWYGQLEAKWGRDMICKLCQDLEIELTDERLAQLATWDADQLRRALRQISISHEWPAS